MVGTEPGDGRDVAEVARPFVAVRWETDGVTQNAGVVGCADCGERLGVDEIRRRAGGGVVDGVWDKG